MMTRIRQFYFLMLSVLLLYHSSVFASRLPSAKRECATCHIMWLTEFKRADVTPLIPYNPKPVEKTGKQDVVSTEKMCFSCHDGYVMDSRFLWDNQKHIHPVGVIPSDDVQIPLIEGKEVFPLNDDGKIYCGTCHSAHGVDWNQKESTIFLRVKNINSSMCVACHHNRKPGLVASNHPVNKRLLSIPEDLRVRGSLFGEKNEVICQSCHQAHGSNIKKLLVRDNNKSQLCTSCHSNKVSILNSKHDLGIMAKKTRNILGKTVSETGPCSACHLPHNGNSPRLWARELKKNVDTVSDYCLGCHSDNGSAHNKTLGEYTHPVAIPVSRVGITATLNKWVSKYVLPSGFSAIIPLPLYDENGQRSKKDGNVTCLTCHDPHKWAHKETAEEISDPGTLEEDDGNSFLRIAYDGSNRLCINCHRKNATIELSRHNLSRSATEAKNINNKMTTDNGSCSACHLPHNGTATYMWARPGGRDYVGIEKMCRTCHQKNGIAKDKLPGEHMHPLHVKLDVLPQKVKPGLPTFLRDGRRNNQQGELECASCHNAHQWQPGKAEDLMVSHRDVEGQADNSFLRISAAKDSKLCLHCHGDKRSILKTDHDMRVTAKQSHNAKGQTTNQSGVCGQCHSVHTPEIPQRLWARKPGPGEDIMESMCRSCHQKGNIAENKVPAQLRHPKRTVSSNKGRLFGGRAVNLLAPVFDSNGKPAPAGLISCPTCHNPHQWDPTKAVTGTGRNREGTVLNSFLRHRHSEYFLCSDCHGEDSLFRYKYFHWDSSRRKHHLYKP